MFRFVIKKIKNKKWMTVSLILGIALLVGICSCHFIFEAGAHNEILDRTFSDYIASEHEYPAVFSKSYMINGNNNIADIKEFINTYDKSSEYYVNLPVVASQFYVQLGESGANSDVGNTGAHIDVGYLENIMDHITIVSGVGFDEAGDVVNPCIISEETMDSIGAVIGETYTFPKIFGDNYTEFSFTIVGVFRKSADDDIFWHKDIGDIGNVAYCSAETYDAIINEFHPKYMLTSAHTVYDYTKINNSNVVDEINYIKELREKDEYFTTNLDEILKSCKADMDRVSTLLYVLELPIIVLLMLFIYMVSNTMVTKEEGEIAALRSRGITRRKIVSMYALQSLIVSTVAGVIGLVLGYILCKIAASAKSFLVFTFKEVGDYSFTPRMFLGMLVGIALAVVFTTIPVIRKSRMTIIEQKAQGSVSGKKAIWEKLFIDIILLGVSIYLLYNYNKQREILANDIINSGSLDPVVFLNASLFIFAVGLFMIRITGYLIAIVDKIFKNKFRPSTYASMLQTRRTYRTQSFIAIFIIMTLANGVLNANLARSINTAMEKRIVYNSGVEVKLSENFTLHTKKSTETWYYDEPDFGRFDELVDRGVATGITKVVNSTEAYIKSPDNVVNKCQFYAINTKEFGQIAVFDDQYNAEHWYNALNELAANPTGAIISSDVAKALDKNIGDDIIYTRYIDKDGMPEKNFTSKVVAIVDAFPGHETYDYSADAEGIISKNPKNLIVINYAQSVNDFGVCPYEVWFKLADGKSANDIREFADKNIKKLNYIVSLDETIESNNSSAMIQITNGMFSINFIISAIVCVIGFLIYWIMSIRSRELIFGVYRAMGVRGSEIRHMLLLEQIICSISAAIIGLGVGFVASMLFIKLIATVYLPYDHLIPITNVYNTSDMAIIGVCVAGMFAVCFTVIIRIVKSMKIANALKLGED